MADLYFQCDLRNGTKATHGYIEARGAKVGAQVEILDGGYDDGLWTITAVSDTGIDRSLLSDMQQKARNPFGSIDGEKKAKG